MRLLQDEILYIGALYNRDRKIGVTNAAEEFEKIEETRKWLLGRKITSKEGENKKNKKQPTKKLNLTVNHCYLSCVYMNIT